MAVLPDQSQQLKPLLLIAIQQEYNQSCPIKAITAVRENKWIDCNEAL